MAGKLNTLRLRKLTEPGTYGDGGGLYLQVRSPENRTWLYRYAMNGRAHLMGLGRLADVSLSEAREAAHAARKLMLSGVDPLTARHETKAAATLHPFAEVAATYIDAHQASWRSAKHRHQWHASLSTYVLPSLGTVPVAEVDTPHVMTILSPIWAATPETASRVRARIEVVLDYAKSQGWRTGENPARWRGHVENLFPKRSKLAPLDQHHAALPWRDIGAFMATLRNQRGVAAVALRFAILTAARTGEAIGATWSEIDTATALWTVPAARMKSGREHRVPLSASALELLAEAAKLRTRPDMDGPVFPGGRPGKPLASRAMLSLLERMQRTDVTTHGFRSTFRDWCGDTGQPADLAEAGLAHSLGNKVQTAYQRGDLLERRRKLMDDWAEFCGQIV